MINTDTVNIGQKLKQAMDESLLSDKQIATKAGVPLSTLYKLQKSPDIKVSTLMKLAGALEVGLQFFFNVEESKLVTELNEALEQERMRVSSLKTDLENIGLIFELQIQLFRELEKQYPDKSEKILFTQLLPEDEKPIPLSSFFYIYLKMIKAANHLPQKEEMYLKYADKFFNIVEVRKIIKENPIFITGKIRDILTEELDNKAVDAFIDIRKLWKNIGR